MKDKLSELKPPHIGTDKDCESIPDLHPKCCTMPDSSYEYPARTGYRDVNSDVDDTNLRNRSKLSKLHNEMNMKKLQESLKSSVENYVKPKIVINEATLHENGEVSLRINVDVHERSSESLLALIRVINRAIKEHEEEILNG